MWIRHVKQCVDIHASGEILFALSAIIVINRSSITSHSLFLSISALHYSLQSIFNHKSLPVSLDIRFSITALCYSLQSILNLPQYLLLEARTHKSLPVSLDIRFSITALRYSLQSIFNHKSLPVSLDVRFSITTIALFLLQESGIRASGELSFALSIIIAINRSSITSHCLFLSMSVFLSPPLRYSCYKKSGMSVHQVSFHSHCPQL